MSMPERYHPECPPDAHKVIRPPESEVLATLCVKVEDCEESNGMVNVVKILSLMSKKPLILCSEAVGPTMDFYDLSAKGSDCSGFLDLLSKKCLICLNTLSMFTLRSVSTVYPWDKLLANQFLGQYTEAVSQLSEDDVKLLTDVRYGRFDALEVENKSKTAYKFLRLERKLFLQYPTEDD